MERRDDECRVHLQQDLWFAQRTDLSQCTWTHPRVVLEGCQLRWLLAVLFCMLLNEQNIVLHTVWR